jgi:hypothetical protein
MPAVQAGSKSTGRREMPADQNLPVGSSPAGWFEPAGGWTWVFAEACLWGAVEMVSGIGANGSSERGIAVSLGRESPDGLAYAPRLARDAPMRQCVMQPALIPFTHFDRSGSPQIRWPSQLPATGRFRPTVGLQMTGRNVLPSGILRLPDARGHPRPSQDAGQSR